MPRSWMPRKPSWRFRKTFPRKSIHTETTTDPSTALRSGRDDKGRAVTFGRLATWMDRIKNDYFAKTADPPLRFAPVGMTRGGRLRFGRLATWMDRIKNDYFAK